MLARSSERCATPLLQAGVRGLAGSALSVASLGLTFPTTVFGKTRVSTPLDEALLNVPPAGLKESLPAAPPAIKVSTTDSGLKIAAVESVHPRSTVSVVVNAGTANETEATFGAAKYLEYMLFKSTWNRSTFRITREIEKIGAVSRAKVGREVAVYSVDLVKKHVPEAVEILLDSVLNARITPWEVAEVREKVKSDMAEALATPELLLSDLLHRAAYEGGLGQPLFADPAVVGSLHYNAVREFLSATFVPSNMTLVAAGADEAVVKSLVTPMLHKTDAVPPAATSSYVGGSMNCFGNTSGVHCALAFEAKGGLSNLKTKAVAEVVKVLLQESTREVLPYQRKELEVASFAPISFLHKGTGLVGVMGSAEAGKTTQLVDFLTKKLETASKGVAEPALVHAKQIVLTACKTTLLSSPGLADTIGAHVVARGAFNSTEMMTAVANVTAGDVTSFVSSMLKTTPTFVAYGKLTHLPRLEAIQKRLAA